VVKLKYLESTGTNEISIQTGIRNNLNVWNACPFKKLLFSHLLPTDLKIKT
jgi:hypothetical protein